MKETVTRFIGILALVALATGFFPCDTHGHDHGCASECACTVHSPVDLAPVDKPCFSVPLADRQPTRPSIPHDFSFSSLIFRPPIA